MCMCVESMWAEIRKESMAQMVRFCIHAKSTVKLGNGKHLCVLQKFRLKIVYTFAMWWMMKCYWLWYERKKNTQERVCLYTVQISIHIFSFICHHCRTPHWTRKPKWWRENREKINWQRNMIAENGAIIFIYLFIFAS